MKEDRSRRIEGAGKWTGMDSVTGVRERDELKLIPGFQGQELGQ